AMTQKGVKIRMGDEFSTALGTAIGVMTTKGVGLAIAPAPFIVAISLVTGDENRYLDPGSRAHTFEQIYHAHGIGLKSGDRVSIRAAHQGLGSKVKHDLRAKFVENLSH